jgi:TP901 family phage tail tape measure protein
MSLVDEAVLLVTIKAQDLASTQTDKATKSLGNLAKAAIALGAAAVIAGVVALGAASLDSAIKYQSLTTSLAAQSGVSVAAAGKVSAAFLATMGTSIYSGSEMMKAYTPISGQLELLAGHALSAAQATGVMKVASDLAVGSGTSLASATSDLSKIMLAYQQPLKDAASTSNILFTASRLTGTSIDQLSQSMVRVRAQMGAAAPPIGAMGGLLVDLTKHGETGRQALTTLGSAFTGIINPTAAVTAAQKAAGVSFTDANGKLLPLKTIFTELQPILAGHSAATNAATLKTLGFGSASIKLAETMMAGPAVLSKYTDQVTKSGAAHAAAEKASKTFAHQMDLLKASLSDAATMIGQKLLPVVMGIVTAVMPVLKGILDWIGQNTKLVTILGGVVLAVAALALGVTAFGFIAGKVTAITSLFGAAQGAAAIPTTDLRLAQEGLNTSLLANPMVWVIVAIVALVAAFVILYTHVTGFRDAVDAFVALVKGAFNDAINFAKQIVGDVTTWIKAHWDQIQADATAVWAVVSAIISVAWTVISSVIKVALTILVAYLKVEWDIISTAVKVAWNIVSTVIGTAITLIIATVKTIVAIVEFLVGVWKTVTSDVSGFVGGVVSFFSGLPGKVIGFDKTMGSTVVSTLKGFWTTVTSDVGKMIGDIVSWFAGLPAKIAHVISGLGGMIGNAIKSTVNNIPVIGKALSAIGLASGGLVKVPTLALVGETEPEVVIPVSKLTAAFASGVAPLSSASVLSGGGGGGGGSAMSATTTTLTIPITLQLDGQTLATIVAKYMGKGMRHQGLMAAGAGSNTG